MQKNSRLLISCFLVFGVPVIAVLAGRQSLGPLRDTPLTRQKGNPAGKVIITEYSDFQCPSCAAVQPALREILQRHEKDVRFAFKHYPLERIHRNALPAAWAAECAANQEKFWPYHDELFSRQKAWSPLSDPTTAFMTIAGDLHIDLERFGKCLQDQSRLLPVRMDKAEGDARQIRSTPTFFVGDQRFVGKVFAEEAERAIERAKRE